MSRTVAVIGGGISGLAAAWELSHSGADVSVTMIEGSDRLGGKLRLEDVGGVRIDVGAESVRGLLTDEEVERLAHETVACPGVGDVSVGDLVDARLGPAVTDRLVEPLLAGVYAGHARELSAEQAVPALAAAAREGSPLLDVARAAAA